jgi:hypothetical protein
MRSGLAGIDRWEGSQVTGHTRRPDEVLGAEVVLTGWRPGREQDLADALEEFNSGLILDSKRLPLVVISRTSLAEGARVRDLLEAAGGKVSLKDAWVTRDQATDVRARPECPSCGSSRTQPFTHAGPVARVNMKCTDCGHLFRAKQIRP